MCAAKDSCFYFVYKDENILRACIICIVSIITMTMMMHVKNHRIVHEQTTLAQLWTKNEFGFMILVVKSNET